MKTLLLVEDNKEIAWCYTEHLKNDFKVIVAENFEEFKEKLKENPSIVITDFNFPGGNGNDVARLAKQSGVKKVIAQSNDISGRIEPNLFDGVFDKTDFLIICEGLARGSV